MVRLEFAVRQFGLYLPGLTPRQARTIELVLKRALKWAEAGKDEKLLVVQAGMALANLVAFVERNCAYRG